MIKSLLIIAIFVTALMACQKGDYVRQDSYMQLTLGAYHPDTSVFAQVKINDVVLTNSQQFHGDEPFNIFLQSGTTIFHDSAMLDVLLVKSSGLNLVYRDTVRFANINDLFLFQACPDSDPFLIDRASGELSSPLPAPDSVKVRFFFSSNDHISNPNPGYAGRLLSRMRLQVFTFTPNTNPNNPPLASSFVSVINALDFDQCGLSAYISLAKNKKYGFRVRDISAGIPSSASANLVQQLLPDNDIQLIYDPLTGFPDWDFKQGKIQIDNGSESNRYQTLRVKRSRIDYIDRSGSDVSDTSLNANVAFGLK